MEFEAWLVARDFIASDLTEKQKTTLQAQWRAEQRTTAPPADEVDTERLKATLTREFKPKPESGTGVDVDAAFAPILKERDRQDEITKLGVTYGQMNPANIERCQDIVADAIENKLTVQETELKLVRAARPNPAQTFQRDEPEVTGNVVEAAVCMAAGLPTLEKEFEARTLDAARKQFKGGLGLADVIHMTARRNGYRGPGVKSDLRENMRYAFRADESAPNLRAGMAGPSTYSLPNTFANVANKFLRAGFLAVDQSWREIAAIRSVNDFRPVSTVSLTSGKMFDVVPRGGELKHGTLGELAYTNQVDTFGQMLGIDRRDIINDDIGAFANLNQRIGRNGALKLNDKFWAAFMNNSTFFTSGHGNVSTGAGSALALAGLTAADLAFRIQTDPDGFPLAATPRILLVPPALAVTANNLMNSTITVATTTANAAIPAGNPFSGLYRVVVSPYLQNANYTGFSATAYYLLADPAEVPVVEVAFLNGQQTPIVEQSDLDWNTLGVAIRGYFDFGVATQEYRGGVRSAGT
jgi:hypothetical protein